MTDIVKQSSDIVRRLQFWGRGYDEDSIWCEQDKDCIEAANEIERLRALCRDAALAIDDRQTAEIICNVTGLLEKLRAEGLKVTK